MFDYISYAKQLRHELHQVPELGFDLPETIGIVRRELDAWGIPYTVDEFGPASIVATINPGKGFTIGLRADMDALPLQEASNNPYPSKHPGIMHACGHDVHTASLLAAGKQLWEMKDQLSCTVKLLFTPAEEYVTPGCKALADNGIMDHIDCAIALHVHPGENVGKVVLLENGYNANSMGILCEFFGKTSHAHTQQKGVDAIRMAVESYIGMELMAAREIPSKDCFVLNVGSFNGGNTNNIVCDYAKMFLSARSWDDSLIDFMERRIREICEGTAKMCGGEAKVTVKKLLPYVDNHPTMNARVRAVAEKLVGKENIVDGVRSMGGEDFAFLTRKKPCAMFRLGVSSDENPDTRNPVHNNKFDADERCFETAVPMFVNFVLENQGGIEF